MLDRRMIAATRNPNMMVPWFLMAAYAYEQLDDPIISDSAWDDLCNRLKQEWKSIHHRHKWIIDRHQLGTATASYLVKDDYPGMVIGAVCQLIQEIRNVRAEKRAKRRARRQDRHR